MDVGARRGQDIFTGVVIMLLLVASSMDGAIVAGLAAALFVAGIALFPATRRFAFIAAITALIVAVVVGLFAR